MPTFVAIDWGSSNRRAYRIDETAGALTLMDKRVDAQGVLTCGGDFAASLASLLAAWPDLPPAAPVFMSGMIGSRSGWHEAAYLPCPMRLTDLGSHLQEVAPPTHPMRSILAGRRITIVPGVCQDDNADVMRGEEMQLLGALSLGCGDGIYLLPGTHCKWVLVQDACITAFRSFMTGELFALLCEHGSLATMLGSDPAGDDPLALAHGFAAAANGVLSHELFALRANVLLGKQSAAHSRAYLSGLLIGSEWQDATVQGWLAASGTARITCIGEAHLVARYEQAARLHGIALQRIDPEAAFVAAAQHLWRHVP